MPRQDALDPDVRRQHRRLRRVFVAILAAIGPASLVQACDKTPPPDTSTGGGGGQHLVPDAGADARADATASPDGNAADAADAAEARDCTMTTSEYDAGIDVDPGCIYSLPCGLAEGFVYVGCDIYTGLTPLGCSLVPDAGCTADAYAPGEGGAVLIDCPNCLGGGGRRPRGLLRARARCSSPASPTGAYFARMAHDEAASVHAFLRMRDELTAHGAPDPLVRAAARSARDEERHARVMARHARTHGASSPVPRVRRPRPRSLEALARENAVEGCVNETFGALLAAWQAEHAPTAPLRRTSARIAADEARHAALSWEVARWAEGRLDRAARARVASARAAAVRALARREAAWPFDTAVGRPAPAERAALIEGLVHRLGLA